MVWSLWKSLWYFYKVIIHLLDGFHNPVLRILPKGTYAHTKTWIWMPYNHPTGYNSNALQPMNKQTALYSYSGIPLSNHIDWYTQWHRWKKPGSKGYMFDFIYMAFWKRQNYRYKNQISSCQWLGVGVEVDGKREPCNFGGVMDLFLVVVVVTHCRHLSELKKLYTENSKLYFLYNIYKIVNFTLYIFNIYIYIYIYLSFWKII